MNNKINVLIADKLSPQASEIFRENGISTDVKTGMTAEELTACIENYDGLAIRSATKVTGEILAQAKKLKVIGRAGIGVDNIDIKSATSHGIVVMNTPFGNSVTTAEHTIALMFAIARNIPAANLATQQGQWEPSRFVGVELTSKTLGLIGCGNIGSIVAERAQALKMKVMAYDPYLSPERADEINIEKVELEHLLQGSDFISLHTPINDGTRGILNKDTLAKTKKGVRIINCARGGLIVESDLKEALESGQVAGAAIDVYENEPAYNNLLFDVPNVISTPHLGASTTEAQEKVAIQVAQQMSAYLTDGTVTNALNFPSVTSKEAARLEPYFKLADMLGSFAGQLAQSRLKEIQIEYWGTAAELNSDPITSVLLKGLLSPLVETVNMVNAPVIAADRDIQISQMKHSRETDYQTLIRMTVKTEKDRYRIAATLFGKEVRIVELAEMKLEASLGGWMLYIVNKDKPGFIGELGRLLGDAGINIANFHLGRKTSTQEAIALVEVDQAVNKALLERINNLINVKRADVLRFDS